MIATLTIVKVLDDDPAQVPAGGGSNIVMPNLNLPNFTDTLRQLVQKKNK